MKKNGIIRTIYLYIFTLLGLVFLTIGCMRFIDMGLKAFIFTQADEDIRVEQLRPPTLYGIEKVESLQKNIQLSADEKIQVDNWLKDYEIWKEKNKTYDAVTSERHRDASWSLAMILVGLPLYLYHWRIIRKETKDTKQ